MNERKQGGCCQSLGGIEINNKLNIFWNSQHNISCFPENFSISDENASLMGDLLEVDSFYL